MVVLALVLHSLISSLSTGKKFLGGGVEAGAGCRVQGIRPLATVIFSLLSAIRNGISTSPTKPFAHLSLATFNVTIIF